MTEETERIYVIPLKKKYFPASNAAPTAIKRVKHYINRHMKVEMDDIWIDESLNNAVWSKGKYKMPSKIRVKAVRFEDGVVEVYLPELEFEKSRREILQEERAKKTPILRKEEAAPEEVDEAGTDDYEVVPTADGDVKLKKKKHKESMEGESEEGPEIEEGKKEESDEEKKPTKETEKLTEKPDEKPAKKVKKTEEASENSEEKDTKEQAAETAEESTDKDSKKKNEQS